ncbi:MAG TPA: nitrile hydratase accessory protein [Acidimicrobiales bacterium]|nr:nitrile hydratase accessory protein [Acidimicrobiales bacterium]
MTVELPDEVALMDGASALPRDNGELVFSAPWEARAVAMAVALVERLELPWDAFRERLIAAVADDPDRPYYESWASALEQLIVDEQLATGAAITAAEPTERAPL